MARRNLMDEIMAEHIRLPGCPQFVVTRAFAYQWLKDCGYSDRDPDRLLDRMVFLARERSEPLTDLADHEEWLAGVQAEIRAEFTSA